MENTVTTTETGKHKEAKFEARCCKHGEGVYSLSVELSADDMLNLASVIKEAGERAREC